jgi:hypothetical protein
MNKAALAQPCFESIGLRAYEVDEGEIPRLQRFRLEPQYFTR